MAHDLLFGIKPLSEPKLDYFQLDLHEQTSVTVKSEYNNFHSKNASENFLGEITPVLSWFQCLNYWGRVTHICLVKLTIIGSDNGLSPERRQAIIWTNAGILSIGPLGTTFREILIKIQTFSLKKIRLKMSSAKCSFRLGFSVLIVLWWGKPVMTQIIQTLHPPTEQLFLMMLRNNNDTEIHFIDDFQLQFKFYEKYYWIIQIATNFSSCHNTCTVMTWAKICDNNFVNIMMGKTWNVLQYA